jgi:predicted glycosyltransferase
MARFVIASSEWDGFGHVHRSALIARALLAADPGAQIALVVGVGIRPPWLHDARVELVRVPRRNAGPTDAVLFERARTFTTAIARLAPSAVLVDRRPFGQAGELREGLEQAKAQGAAVVLGLTDVLGDPDEVATEITGPAWGGVPDLFDTIVVYGDRRVCDHLAQYKLPIPPRYCGWVAEPVSPLLRQHDLLLVAVTEDDHDAEVAAAVAAVGHERGWRVVLVTDASGDLPAVNRGDVRGLEAIADVRHTGPPPAQLFAAAGAVVLSPSAPLVAAALAAGCRPVVLRRRSPPADHLVRATRFADLGLADLVDEAEIVSGVGWELDRRRYFPSGARAGAPLCVTGADRVAAELQHLAAASAA